MTPMPPPLPPRRPMPPRIEWPTAAVLLGVLASMTAVWALASPEQRADLLTGIGAAGSVMLAIMRAILSRQDPPPPTSRSSANGIDRHDPLQDDRGSHLPGSLRVALLVPLAIAVAGCGASALRTHATVGTVAAVTVASTAPLVAPACDAALTDCHGDAACIDRTGATCLAASRAHDAARAGVTAYLDAIEVAALADEGEVLPALATGLRGLAALWEAARVALAPLRVELPALPPVVLTLLGGAS